MLTNRQFASLLAATYLLIVVLLVGTPLLAVAIGTVAAWFGALNLASLSQTLESMTPVEAMLYLRGWA